MSEKNTSSYFFATTDILAQCTGSGKSELFWALLNVARKLIAILNSKTGSKGYQNILNYWNFNTIKLDWQKYIYVGIIQTDRKSVQAFVFGYFFTELG